MKKVIVFDVAASSGGALSVLKSFHHAAVSAKDVQWVFVLSAPHVEETDNIEVKVYSWIKKSKLHRLFFDYFVAPTIVKKEETACVLSLQNTNIPFVKNKQIVYVHQSIPFCDIKFSIRRNPIEWLYQNVIGRFICKSIRKADAVVVQTNWMKKAVVEKTGVCQEKILVEPPTVKAAHQLRHSYSEESGKRFFYPAAYVSYKNHAVIIRAAQLLCQQGVEDFQVIFTADTVGPLTDTVQKHIRCVGTQPFEKVQQLYTQCVLLFPSLLETFGLPLVEAAIANAPIVAANKPYAKEVLSGYENAAFFDPHDPVQLAQIMKQHICADYLWREQNSDSFTRRYTGFGWNTLLNYIKES